MHALDVSANIGVGIQSAENEEQVENMDIPLINNNFWKMIHWFKNTLFSAQLLSIFAVIVIIASVLLNQSQPDINYVQYTDYLYY